MDLINDYLKIKSKISQDKENNSIFTYQIIKMNIEIELQCFQEADNTFTDIIRLKEPQIMPWPFLVRGAFLLGRIGKLYDAFLRWNIQASEIDCSNRLNYLFMKYIDIIGKNTTDTLGELITRVGDHSELKSIMYYLLTLSTDNKVLTEDYIKLGYNNCKYNFSLLYHAIEHDIPVEFFRWKDYLGMNVNDIGNIRCTRENKLSPGIEVCILGGGNTIGGSCYLIKATNLNIMIDMGVSFGSNDDLIPPDLGRLKEFGLDGLHDIDVFLLSHAHMDHSGAVLNLCDAGNHIKKYATAATCDLTYRLLHSSIKRQSDDYQTEKYKLDYCMAGFIHVEYRTPVILYIKGSRLKLEFFRAGHILGAASIYIEINDKSVFFTGDYCLENQHTVEGLDVPQNYKIDLLISESTYGSSENISTIPRIIQEQLFARYICKCMEEGKKILIPAFAVGRSQEIILILKDYFMKNYPKPFRIYIDGLVTDMCDIYTQYTGLRFIGKGIYNAGNNQGYSSKEEFIEKEVMEHCCCVIASSGMLKDESASSYYAEYFLQERNAVCVLTGYQDEDSVGYKLKKLNRGDDDQYININGKPVRVQCEVSQYYLSAHCQIIDIIKLVVDLNPGFVLLVHGEADEQGTHLSRLLGKLENIRVTQAYNNKSYFI